MLFSVTFHFSVLGGGSGVVGAGVVGAAVVVGAVVEVVVGLVVVVVVVVVVVEVVVGFVVGGMITFDVFVESFIICSSLFEGTGLNFVSTVDSGRRG